MGILESPRKRIKLFIGKQTPVSVDNVRCHHRGRRNL